MGSLKVKTGELSGTYRNLVELTHTHTNSRRRHDQKVLRSANTLMLQGSIEQALLFVASEGSKLVVLHVPDHFSSKGAESLVDPSDAGPEDIGLVGEAQGLAEKKEDAEAGGRPVYLGRPS